MILEYNGQRVDFFQKIFTENVVAKNFNKEHIVRKLGVWVSGGADSAFSLWYMAKCINDNQLWDFELIPMHGHDMARVADSRISANAVVDYVKEAFPKVDIHDNYIFQYHKEKSSTDKGKFHDPIKNKLKEDEIIHITVNSYTANPPVKDMVEGGFYHNRDCKRDDPVATFTSEFNAGVHGKRYGTNVKSFFDTHRPLSMVDKKFIAHFYKEYNIMNLFYKTVSCTSGYEGEIIPCKKCFWCKEKYWAFGMYDGGVK